MKPNCYNCKHAQPIPGDAHFKCVCEMAVVLGHPFGIKNGWFCWPWNFDPIWLVSCDSFEKKEN